jgi:membrane protease YdiL (CAAX protease family)
VTDLRQAYVFIGATLLLSWAFEAWLILHGGVRSLGPLWLVALMCIPGSVACALRLLLRTGFADAGLQPGARRFYAYAVAVPLLLALLAGAIAAAADIRRIAPVATAALPQLSSLALPILALGVVGAVGEELGWRGFLLPKLVKAGAPHPYLATGVVWAIWHLPLIGYGGFYATDRPLLMALVYGTGILALNALISELRMRAGSVWVAAAQHAAHNFFFQFGVPVLILTVPGSRAAWWDLICSDTGLSVAALYALAYCALQRFGRSGATNVQGASTRGPAHSGC